MPGNSLSHVKCLGEVTSGSLKIGAVSAPIYNAHEKMKVPDVLFYDNLQVRSALCIHGSVTAYRVVITSNLSETNVYRCNLRSSVQMLQNEVLKHLLLRQCKILHSPRRYLRIGRVATMIRAMKFICRHN